jgi:heat shock protein HslJ
MALPPAAVFEAVLEDVSRADAPAETVARTPIGSPGNPRIGVGDRLDPFDATGNRVAAITAGARVATQPDSPSLAGTTWQLVRFQGGDGTTLTPDDRAKYTIEFGAGGRLNARIDCNRGRGTWKSAGTNQVEFGPLALTRAKCPAGSLHDQIVKQWGYIRSYVIKDGHLFLSLMADGGIYEFEPFKKTALQSMWKEHDDGSEAFSRKVPFVARSRAACDSPPLDDGGGAALFGTTIAANCYPGHGRPQDRGRPRLAARAHVGSEARHPRRRPLRDPERFDRTDPPL